ncbi:MAG: primosomal protein N', partial [Longicatena sp.]
DLLEQASGRSGRGDKDGEVIIQAYDCSHYAIQCAAHHDYQTFFLNEMNYRHLAKYPPYTYIISMVFIHKQEACVIEGVKACMHLLENKVDCKVLGPASLHKIKDETRMRILLKGKQQSVLLAYVREVYLHHQQSKQKARLEIDVAPINLE